MRQKILIAELNYKENLDGVEFESYPQPPNEVSPHIVRLNADKRIYKMITEQPEIGVYSLEEIEDDDEEGIVHPLAAVVVDELRLAGFCKLEEEGQLAEYITPQTCQIYLPIEPYHQLLAVAMPNLFADDKPS